MANWTFTVNETTYESPTISVGLWSAVAQLLNGRAHNFGDLDPFIGPDQLAAWYAVLAADSSDNKNVQFHLEEAMAMPMVQLVSMVNVE